jgi:AraC-like DNA-binding protein
MDLIKIAETASKIQHLTDLNTYVINQNGDLIFHNEMIAIPPFMPGANREDIFNLYSEIKQQNNRLYIYPNSWGLFYMGYTFSISEEFSIIIGPYVELTLNSLQLTNKYQLTYNESEDLAIFSNQIHILNAEKAQSYSSILPLFKEILENTIAPIIVRQTNDSHQNHQSTDSYLNNVNANNLVNQRYKVETDLLHAVEQGNKTEAIKLLNADNALFTFSERLPRQPLRRIKNLAIVLNTLLRTTAKRNQVPPILIHRVSEKFALQIENKSQLAELTKLQNQMIEEYADLIVESSLSQFSKITQTVISYIMTYYDQKIDIQKLADVCFTHSSHLSRKFKQETNMTITAFQQNIRMRQAKHLLQNEIIPIEEIAWMVGYEDPSYFSRVFKQDTGYTPTQFREYGDKVASEKENTNLLER